MVAVRTDTGAFYDCFGATWNAVAGGGGGTVTNVSGTTPITVTNPTTTPVVACATCTTSAAALTSNNLIIGSGGQAEAALGSLGSATTVLHGGAGAPTFGAVALATDVSGQLPIGAVGSAGLSGTAPITISAAGAIGCATCATGTTVSSFSGDGTVITNSSSTGAVTTTIAGTSGGVPYFSSSSGWASSAALTANSPILGGGAGTAPKVSTGITSNGSSELDLGLNGTASGVLGFNGSTSGKATFTAPAVAGTSTNPVTMTNVLAAPVGSSSAAGYGFTGCAVCGLFVTGSTQTVVNNGSAGITRFYTNGTDAIDLISFDLRPNTSASLGAGQAWASVNSGVYDTASNCSSSASPAVCGSAAAGSIVIAAAATTVTVNTSAVTANSQILLLADDTLGTKLSVTCNSTLATLIGGLAVTARTGGTSFQITSGATPAVNPLCISYIIIN